MAEIKLIQGRGRYLYWCLHHRKWWITCTCKDTEFQAILPEPNNWMICVKSHV